ncbi:hypothetical protein [Dryocola clanedunensis]|uniref:hypothetical protein n=1 Tax=Cedecea sulfonylureivorans TaxID=3051154 RepID=UPI0019274B48|nr:hypothetical protein [Cedecea sulfonylureivorans]
MWQFFGGWRCAYPPYGTNGFVGRISAAPSGGFSFAARLADCEQKLSVDDADAYPPYGTDCFVGRISVASSGELSP